MAIDKQDARILVVDDDKELADGLVESLSSLGYLAKATYSHPMVFLLQYRDSTLE